MENKSHYNKPQKVSSVLTETHVDFHFRQIIACDLRSGLDFVITIGSFEFSQLTPTYQTSI